MASAGSMIVEFMDDVPNENFCTVSLEIRGLKIHQPHWGAKSVMKNGKILAEEFKTRSILVKIEVEGVVYEYQRDLPVDLDPSQSKCKFDVKHAESVLLKIRKAEKSPWVKYDMLFIGED